jgi:hypothetical protein
MWKVPTKVKAIIIKIIKTVTNPQQLWFYGYALKDGLTPNRSKYLKAEHILLFSSFSLESGMYFYSNALLKLFSYISYARDWVI